MSDILLGTGKCVEQSLAGISDRLILAENLTETAIYAPENFLNPQAANIAELIRSGNDAEAGLVAYRAGLLLIVPPPPDLAEQLANVDAVIALIQGDYRGTIIQYTDWTEFCSGKQQVFPYDSLTVIMPPGTNGMYLLTGLGFAGLLGMVAGGSQSAFAKCELDPIDPDDPCAGVKKVLGAIMGALNSMLSAIIAGMDLILNSIGEALSIIQGFINQIVGAIAEAISALIGMMVKALRDGMARLLKGLHLNPCFTQIMGTILVPELAAAVAAANSH